LRGVGLHPNGKLENDLLLVGGKPADLCGDMVKTAATELDRKSVNTSTPAAF